jgi:C4-dicarboxylate-specific signal transduction histidine kinase
MAGRGNLTIVLDDLRTEDSDAIGLRIPSGRHGRLTLSDDGPGIPTSVLQHIFEPFFTTKQIGEGTGLGLSIVQGIVKSWGGEIGARTLPAGGAEFTILLPIEDGLAAADKDAPRVALNEFQPVPTAAGT